LVLSDDKLIKQGKFNVRYSSAKKYQHEKGKLVLTSKSLLFIFNNNPIKPVKNHYIRLKVCDDCLEVYDSNYNKLKFKLLLDEPQDWKKIFDDIKWEKINRKIIGYHAIREQRQKELQNLFDMSSQALIKLYQDTAKEREQFQRKNIRFNLDIQSSYLYEGIKDRKLRAFVIAHSYVAWYEWIKRILQKLMRAKTGQGPKNDKELLDFLDDYPKLKQSIDTTDWELKPNRMRNCVAHEEFYFDYRLSELIFMDDDKEKSVMLHKSIFKIDYCLLRIFFSLFYYENVFSARNNPKILFQVFSMQKLSKKQPQTRS